MDFIKDGVKTKAIKAKGLLLWTPQPRAVATKPSPTGQCSESALLRKMMKCALHSGLLRVEPLHHLNITPQARAHNKKPTMQLIGLEKVRQNQSAG